MVRAESNTPVCKRAHRLGRRLADGARRPGCEGGRGCGVLASHLRWVRRVPQESRELVSGARLGAQGIELEQSDQPLAEVGCEVLLKRGPKCAGGSDGEALEGTAPVGACEQIGGVVCLQGKAPLRAAARTRS